MLASLKWQECFFFFFKWLYAWGVHILKECTAPFLMMVCSTAQSKMSVSIMWHHLSLWLILGINIKLKEWTHVESMFSLTNISSGLGDMEWSGSDSTQPYSTNPHIQWFQLLHVQFQTSRCPSDMCWLIKINLSAFLNMWPGINWGIMWMLWDRHRSTWLQGLLI